MIKKIYKKKLKIQNDGIYKRHILRDQILEECFSLIKDNIMMYFIKIMNIPIH